MCSGNEIDISLVNRRALRERVEWFVDYVVRNSTQRRNNQYKNRRNELTGIHVKHMDVQLDLYCLYSEHMRTYTGVYERSHTRAHTHTHNTHTHTHTHTLALKHVFAHALTQTHTNAHTHGDLRTHASFYILFMRLVHVHVAYKMRPCDIAYSNTMSIVHFQLM
jgi:hypothetical protein